MAESEEVLKGFNDILDLRQAYAWNADSIMKFLCHVVTYGYLYDIQDHQIPALRAMVARIEMLRPPQGNMFASPGLEPDISMGHVLNPGWDPSIQKRIKVASR
ncbi:Ankyrin repeat-containing domain [Penicillium digitatum]|uniref:Ankyrin repeat-containing domain n=1 Tax=Penicillium digitatum TaxID=36651 RepID=A0A7T6XUK3_PENDI|nr:Ankyrin repeat-containing domain [Penicillium digitatum]